MEKRARIIPSLFKKRTIIPLSIRKEKQEYPHKPLGDAFMDKMKEVDEECGGDGDSPSGLHNNSSNSISPFS